MSRLLRELAPISRQSGVALVEIVMGWCRENPEWATVQLREIRARGCTIDEMRALRVIRTVADGRTPDRSEDERKLARTIDVESEREH